MIKFQIIEDRLGKFRIRIATEKLTLMNSARSYATADDAGKVAEEIEDAFRANGYTRSEEDQKLIADLNGQINKWTDECMKAREQRDEEAAERATLASDFFDKVQELEQAQNYIRNLKRAAIVAIVFGLALGYLIGGVM